MGDDKGVGFFSPTKKGIALFVFDHGRNKYGRSWSVTIRASYFNKTQGEWKQKQSLFKEELTEVLRCGLNALRYMCDQDGEEMPADLCSGFDPESQESLDRSAKTMQQKREENEERKEREELGRGRPKYDDDDIPF